ncbi:TPA: DUF3895 domain-containing protein [Bacillus cereus]|nr:DUF3895 domain-containing protein [Bacillus cereus]
MASKVILDDTTRSNIFASLTEKQKDFLQQHVKRGKKTTFANVMALDKGIVLPNHATDAEIQTILDEWVLIEYIDNGERNVNTPPRQTEPIQDIGMASDSNGQVVLDLFQEIDYFIEQQENISWDLTYEHQKAIEYYLQKGVSSAWVLCELLMKEHNAPKDRYATRKPKMYVPVCMYLDELVKQGTIRLVEIDGKLDRMYK